VGEGGSLAEVGGGEGPAEVGGGGGPAEVGGGRGFDMAGPGYVMQRCTCHDTSRLRFPFCVLKF
jgi:hypothetical protein